LIKHSIAALVECSPALLCLWFMASATIWGYLPGLRWYGSPLPLGLP